MTLEELNRMSDIEAREELTKCCGAYNWVSQMLDKRPYATISSLVEQAVSNWNNCTEIDWVEAFKHHPKIGDLQSLEKRYNTSKTLAVHEQKKVGNALDNVISKLAKMNQLYEEKFGFIFIVFATGKTAEEMLIILEKRINNERPDEIINAMVEQNKITVNRLNKLLL